MRAELGLIGALFAAAAFYPAMMRTMGEAEASGGQIKDASFAKDYAGQVAKLVGSEDFDAMVKYALIEKMPNADKMDEATKLRLIAAVKLIMLMTALALVSKVEMGHLTGLDIAGMIKGEVKLPKGDPRIPLLALIGQQLRALPRRQRATLLEAIFEYFDTDPSVDDLLEPSHLLQEGADNHEFERSSQNAV